MGGRAIAGGNSWCRIFNGRTVVITAAGQGIGRATAERFISLGARVIATDINEQALSTLKGAETRVLNVLDGDGVKDFAADIGHADVLFNCAGFVHSGTILDCEEKDWDFSFDLNAKAMYRTCRAFLPGMLEKGKGAIVNMSSVASSVKGVPNRFAYTASKAAVVGLTKAIAADFVTKGIRCNAICPARWTARPCMTGCALPAITNRLWRISSPASRWAASPRRKKSQLL